MEKVKVDRLIEDKGPEVGDGVNKAIGNGEEVCIEVSEGAGGRGFNWGPRGCDDSFEAPLVDGLVPLETNVHVEYLHYNNEDDIDDSGQEEGDGGEEKKPSRHLGKQVSLGLMKDVLSQFYVKKRTLPPSIPLCSLVVHEAVRFARDDNEWLISSFDSFAYLETMGHFLVLVGDSQGDVMHVTSTDLENWGPLWRQRNDDYERKLGKEWQELKSKKFLVRNGNHRLKTWWKRIKDKYVDNIEYHVSVRCQFLEVTKAKEAELLLALDTSNAALVTPNIAHEVYMFQKFGLANKESILNRLTLDMREWAKVEMTVETTYYSWCFTVDEFNAFMSKEITKVDALGLNDLEKKKPLDKATKVKEERLKDRGYKYLLIANPLKDDEFFSLLFGIKWDDPGFKKESNEYVEGVLKESVPQVSHKGTLVTIESGSQATPLENNALAKSKGPTKPPDVMERYCIKVEDHRGDTRDLVLVNPSIVDKWGMTGTKEKVDIEPEEAPPTLNKPNLKLQRVNDMTKVNTDNIFLGLYKYDGGEHTTYYRCKESLLRALIDEKKLNVFTYGEDAKTKLIMIDKYGRSYENVDPKELARYTYFGGPLPNYYFTPPIPEPYVRHTESMGYPVFPDARSMLSEVRPMGSFDKTTHLESGTHSTDTHAREAMSHGGRDAGA
ncbi:hypothetical protein L7F22_044373 [Adiantum nelumboides]|nr:hypothetical protein [Adiantum nelumboides]